MGNDVPPGAFSTTVRAAGGCTAALGPSGRAVMAPAPLLVAADAFQSVHLRPRPRHQRRPATSITICMSRIVLAIIASRCFVAELN